MKRLLLPAFTLLAFSAAAFSADAPKPLKVLLLTGGCCHDYAAQKDILKKGLEARANVIVDQVHSDDKSTKPPLPIYGNPTYAQGYDLVIHDECAADIKDVAVVEGVLKPHRDGIPGVNLHCAMHCYRTGNPGKPQTAGTPESLWFDYLGLQSSGHGPQEPIKIDFSEPAHAITKTLSGWTTIKEELYNNIQIFPSAQPIATGIQMVKSRKKSAEGADAPVEKEEKAVVAWTNTYNGKTRVFSTTIGHNNQTVEDARYLDLVANGVLWACDKLDEAGKPKAGYGAPTAK